MTELAWWIIEQKTHLEILEILRNQSTDRPWASYFLRDHPLNPGDLNSVCRIGFVPYDRCVQDRYFYIDQSKNPEILAAGGITTQIYWDSDPKSLPAGWQGAVRQSYLDSHTKGQKPNTQVALLAFTLPRFRKRGFSGKVVSKMCITAQNRGYHYLLLPTLPPTQFQKEHVQVSMEEIANLKRTDGDYQDYWLRLHTNRGASVVGNCEQSHRFVFSLNDFSRYVSSDRIEKSGEHIVRLDKDQLLGPNRNNMWQLVYADVERSFVVFNWGCIWVQYDLQTLDFAPGD
jgi:hypothetical protein